VQPDGSAAILTVDDWAQTVHDVYGALMNDEFFPVVPVTQVQKGRVRGLLTVSEIQVDSTYDVIRRRRVHTTKYRKTLPL
jgi:hypothetical protein